MDAKTITTWVHDFRFKGVESSKYHHEAMQQFRKEVLDKKKARQFIMQDYRFIDANFELTIETELPNTCLLATLANGNEALFSSYESFIVYWKNETYLRCKEPISTVMQSFYESFLTLRTVACKGRTICFASTSKPYGGIEVTKKYYLTDEKLTRSRPAIVREGYIDDAGFFVEIITY